MILPMTPPLPFSIRRATTSDLPTLGRLGAELMRVHQKLDSRRFLPTGPDSETRYAAFLGDAIENDEAAVIVAERDGVVAGYLYAEIEPPSLKELRDTAGFIHDILVTERHRRAGIAKALLAAALGWLRERGVRQVILGTAWENEGARRLFRSAGFRETMIEMSLEMDKKK